MKPFEQQTYYELLEVPVSAPADDIRAAYSRLMELYAPDSIAVYALVDPEQVDSLRARMTEAMEILTDADLRAEYDRELGLPARRMVETVTAGGRPSPEATPAAGTVARAAEALANSASVSTASSASTATTVAREQEAVKQASTATPPPSESATSPVGTGDFRASFFRGFSFAYVSSSLQDTQLIGSSVFMPSVASTSEAPAASTRDSVSASTSREPASSSASRSTEAAPTTASTSSPVASALESAPAPVGVSAAASEPVPVAPAPVAAATSPAPTPVVPAAVAAASEPVPAPTGVPAAVAVASPPVPAPTGVPAAAPAPAVAPAAVVAASEPAVAAPPERPAPIHVSGPPASVPASTAPMPASTALATVPGRKEGTAAAPASRPGARTPSSPVSPASEPGRAAARPGSGRQLGDAQVLSQDSAIATAEAALAQVAARVREPQPRPRTPDIPADAEFNGELLRRVREARACSLQQVADRTRISKGHLENVEADRYSALPPPVYLRGILMNLARELGLDPLRVSRSYLALASEKTGKK